MTYEAELETALAAARDAGAILLRHYAGDRESWEKSKDNPVTHADLEANRAIVTCLREAFPDYGLLSEETVDASDRTERRRVWIVDPMDGTKEFVEKIPEFAVSIALAEEGEPVVGVVLNPAGGSCVWAARGAGTWRDGERVRVSPCARLEDARVIASRTEIRRDRFEPYAGWFKELTPMGSIAWKLAVVAAGDADLNVSVAPKNEWDVCAGDLLIREAGGLYVDFAAATRRYNQPDPHIDRPMAAGPRPLVEAFCRREQQRRA